VERAAAPPAGPRICREGYTFLMQHRVKFAIGRFLRHVAASMVLGDSRAKRLAGFGLANLVRPFANACADIERGRVLQRPPGRMDRPRPAWGISNTCVAGRKARCFYLIGFSSFFYGSIRIRLCTCPNSADCLCCVRDRRRGVGLPWRALQDEHPVDSRRDDLRGDACDGERKDLSPLIAAVDGSWMCKGSHPGTRSPAFWFMRLIADAHAAAQGG